MNSKYNAYWKISFLNIDKKIYRMIFFLKKKVLRQRHIGSI